MYRILNCYNIVGNAYEVVGKEVQKYCKTHHISDVVVLLRLDGVPHEVAAFCESDNNYEKIEFNTDFWEGEQNIEVELIKPLWEVLEYYRDHVKKEVKKDV